VASAKNPSSPLYSRGYGSMTGSSVAPFTGEGLLEMLRLHLEDQQTVVAHILWPAGDAFFSDSLTE